MGAGADADGGHPKPLGHQAGQFQGDGFQDHGEHSGPLQVQGVVQNAAGLLKVLALDLELAQMMDGLGSQADMAQHRDLGFDHGFDELQPLGAGPFDFDPPGARFFQEAGSVADGLLRGKMKGKIGHVADDQRPPHGPGDGPGVVEHVLHGHGNGVGVAQHDHAQRVAYQDKVHSRLVHGLGRGKIIGGKGHDLVAGSLLGLEVRDRDF